VVKGRPQLKKLEFLSKTKISP